MPEAVWKAKMETDVVKENHGAVMEFIEEFLTAESCPGKERMRLLIAADEVFGNIINYSGASRVVVECGRYCGRFLLRFLDDGVSFNPLDREEPDVDLSAEEREIGGLGIYLVKKNMTDVSYEYSDGKNCLTLEKEVEKYE